MPLSEPPPTPEYYIPQYFSTSVKTIKGVIPRPNEMIESDRLGDDTDTDVNDQVDFNWAMVFSILKYKFPQHGEM